MSSLVLLPSSSLLPAFPCSVHGAAVGLPTSPNSSWSPSASPQSRMQSLYLASSASSPVPAYTLPQPHHSPAAAPTSNAVVAHVLASPSPLGQPLSAAAATGTASPAAHSPYSHRSPLVLAANQTYLSAAPSSMSPAPAVLSVSASTSAPAQMYSAPQSLAPTSLQSGQSIVFDASGQAFLLSPLTNLTPTPQPPMKQQTVQLQQYAVAQYPTTSMQSFSAGPQAEWLQPANQQPVTLGSAVSTQSNTIVLSQQPPLYQQTWGGGGTVSLAGAPMSVSQQLYTSQPVTSTLTVPMSSNMLHAPAQPIVLTTGPLLHASSPVQPTSSTSFSGPTVSLSAGLSPVPVLPSAFQPTAKRALSANVSPSLVPSLRPLSPAVAPLHAGKPASPHPSAAVAGGDRTPHRKMSAASSLSIPSSRYGSDSEPGAQLLHAAPSLPRTSSDSGGEQSTSPRIDGLSSSRLLTHINKKPSHVLPFVIHRSQLPHNFDHLVNAASSSAQPSTSTHQSAAAGSGDMVTVNIRVMGGPALDDLYFVAADISQLIHSRKSNIAKAVSVFTDDERARCSVVCPRSNNTQSTHILTVLTMAGVKRLLHSSRSTIALPLLAWLQDKVDQIVAQETSGRPQQQQQRPAQLSAGSSKRRSGAGSSERERLEDVKEDDDNGNKRLRRE